VRVRGVDGDCVKAMSRRMGSCVDIDTGRVDRPSYVTESNDLKWMRADVMGRKMSLIRPVA
jgi:hypothetical protein